MANKVDYKKDEKHLYVPGTEPVILDVPKLPYVMIDGSGDPNGGEFGKVVEALYGLSYAVRMSHKSGRAPEGYYEYTVYPLEGVWDLLDYSKPATDKSNFKYTMMIRQPDFVTEESFQHFLEQTKRKKANPYLEVARFGYVEDGLSCQMMHIGSFDEEPASFARMETYCSEHGYVRASKLHREIYLSDPRKTAPEKLKTVLRFAVRAAGLAPGKA